MTVFGDFEPEDAYDAGDPVNVQARNLARRLEHLADLLAARGGRADARIRYRFELLADHLDELRARID